METKDCEVCEKLIKEKYRHYKVWRNLAIIFMFITMILAILYFSSGQMLVEETVENEIEIENQGGENQNNVVIGEGSTISGTVTTESESNIGVIVIVCTLIVAGGLVCGCYIIASKKNNK